MPVAISLISRVTRVGVALLDDCARPRRPVVAHDSSVAVGSSTTPSAGSPARRLGVLVEQAARVSARSSGVSPDTTSTVPDATPLASASTASVRHDRCPAGAPGRRRRRCAASRVWAGLVARRAPAGADDDGGTRRAERKTAASTWPSICGRRARGEPWAASTSSGCPRLPPARSRPQAGRRTRPDCTETGSRCACGPAAPAPGFEPELGESKSPVLPLHHAGLHRTRCHVCPVSERVPATH